MPPTASAAAPRDVDVAIIGGGMVGASLAAGLAGSGASVLLVESTPFDSPAQQSFDERTTALGNASRRIFEGLGCWQAIAPQAAAIRSIHVSQGGRFGSARLEALEQGVEAFGYVIANRVIGAALWSRLAAAPGVTVRAPARAEDLTIDPAAVHFTVAGASAAGERYRARLIVGADGAQSQVRAAAGIAAAVRDYDQVAVVASVTSDRPHQGVAYERFTDSGPLAVLPLCDGALAVIWAVRPDHAQELLALDDASYLARLQQRFGWRAGRLLRVGRRASYRLELSRAASSVAPRAVLIGNAAQALHPVAGQGFNLGLRDAAMLAELIAAGGDVGAPPLLERYAAERARDRANVVRFTDSLVQLFASAGPGVGMLRGIGLVLFDLTPPAKSALARLGSGLGGPTPRLARGLPLRHV